MVRQLLRRGRRNGLADATASLVPVEPHPVVEAVLARALSGSRPGRRTDDFKIGLVVEGGAMRGVISGGMVAGLEALGLRDAFDVVYGASAGACAGAYFLAGQARMGARLYYEVVNSRSFINPLHPFRKKAIFDLDRLFEQVLGRQLRLDFEQFTASGVEMVVLASHVDVVATPEYPAPHPIVEAVRFSGFTDLDDLMGALHASSRMPIVGGAPFTYRGMRFWDAAITQPVPIHAALADGCTHILTLLTLPRDVRPGGFGLLDRLLVAPRVANVSPGLALAYRTRSERYRETCQLILSRSQNREGPPFVEGISAAPATPLIGRTEIRTSRLIAAARAGGDAVLAAFGRADSRMTHQLLPVNQHGHHINVRLGPADAAGASPVGPDYAEADAEAS